ncbi:MAG: T9SS type A sorting domain-containing protein [Candidatus Marinimicrobia bacterium]|nr:T9SS type A sorting domain-containing protein [Candidatus Neomarinimicrobiota bacterium]
MYFKRNKNSFQKVRSLACFILILATFIIFNENLIAQEALDFGDAPDFPGTPFGYNTVLANNGACHGYLPQSVPLFFGSVIDFEPDGQPTISADGDDINPTSGVDDEDGIIITAIISGTLIINSVLIDGGPAGGYVDAWLDWNQNGVFDHPLELIIPSIIIPPGVIGSGTVTSVPLIPIPPSWVNYNTYARFRISSVGNLPPYGFCLNGEVEDYIVEVVLDESLPVELHGFKATILQNAVEVTWQTESEIDNLGFEVYRSYDENSTFELISSFETNDELLGLGNSSTGKTYHYLDTQVLPKGLVWYKIADVTSSGLKKYHGPIQVEFAENKQALVPSKIELLPNYPNPFNPGTTINYRLFEKGLVNISVYDIQGKLVSTLLSKEQEMGQYSIEWTAMDDSGNDLPSGIYIVHLSQNITTKTRRILLMR